MLKQAFFKIKGMQRDLSESAFNPEYSYENKNIRIMSTTENTTLSVTNERGTRKFTVNGFIFFALLYRLLIFVCIGILRVVNGE